MTDTILLITPDSRHSHYWQDLWRYRELFWQLAKRDISVRYKQTVIGAAWAIVRPLLTMLVFTVVFGRLAKLPSAGDVPYAILVFVGMLPWYLSSTALAAAADSMITGTSLIGKVYFPRLIIPIASMVVALVDFAISALLLAALMLWYQVLPDWRILMLPAFILLAILTAAGPGIWFASLSLKYRDFRFVVPFLVQLGLYVSPVGFSSNIVPEAWRWLYQLNPMVGVIDGFRWCLLGGAVPLNTNALLSSLAVTVVLLWLGLRRFRRTERFFADIA
ncbi:phosphate ABC transporter permease [Ahniella affigens]|uniref:Transport permease protein n=1 Tax=Ahniella affigens TaxID=2021234 RepID=A0A2P1PYG8_9GAMM|nr:ABC transporter permease [Ahniella affigens]AVP99886.1 phosphate ABC transporter permease [Ahniella affigens]